MNDIEKKLDSLENRIMKLEKFVFTKKEKPPKMNIKKYDGLTGGISLLIDQGYFKKPVTVVDILNELKRENYVYSRQAVDIILRRDFVKKKKILTRIKENDVWKYVIRK